MSPVPTIGVFDSGFGGLTVLRELLRAVPHARYLYLGDTARLPYGSKSQATIARYAVESARFLEDRGATHLVIACNTASALALPEITATVRIPVTDVVAPGARSAWSTLTPHHPNSGPARDLPSHPRQALILATQATVSSHAYQRACAALGLRTVEKACPLLVPLVEEGWIDHPVTREVVRIYLTEALADGSPDAVILGCTHYPLLAAQIEQALRTLGSHAQVIDSAHATACTVRQALQAPPPQPTPVAPPNVEFYVTDSVEKFERLGARFLGQPVTGVQLLDLGG